MKACSSDYDRPAVRLTQPSELPVGEFAALIRQEWEEWGPVNGFELVATLNDQQGDPIILVQKARSEFQPH